MGISTAFFSKLTFHRTDETFEIWDKSFELSNANMHEANRSGFGILGGPLREV